MDAQQTQVAVKVRMAVNTGTLRMQGGLGEELPYPAGAERIVGWGRVVLPGRAKTQGPCLPPGSRFLRAARASKLEQQGGKPSLVPTQGKLDQTAQEINLIFQHHGRLAGQ